MNLTINGCRQNNQSPAFGSFSPKAKALLTPEIIERLSPEDFALIESHAFEIGCTQKGKLFVSSSMRGVTHHRLTPSVERSIGKSNEEILVTSLKNAVTFMRKINQVYVNVGHSFDSICKRLTRLDATMNRLEASPKPDMQKIMELGNEIESLKPKRTPEYRGFAIQDGIRALFENKTSTQ